MELRQLRYFLAVVAAGSINRGAARLGIAQSAVSRCIAELERELGVALLRRGSEGATLTPEGEVLASSAAAIIRDVEALKRAVTGRASQTQTLRLGLPPTITPIFLDTLTEQFEIGHQSMRPSVVEGTSYWLRRRLDADDLDCAILTSPEASSELRVEPLWTESLCVIGPADSPLASMTSCQIRDIADIPLTQTPLPDYSRQVIEQGFAKHGLAPNIAQEQEALQWVIEQIRLGAHSILPRTASRRLHAAAEHCEVPVEGLEVRRGFVARRGRLSTDVESFLIEKIRNAARLAFENDPWLRLG